MPARETLGLSARCGAFLICEVRKRRILDLPPDQNIGGLRAWRNRACARTTALPTRALRGPCFGGNDRLGHSSTLMRLAGNAQQVCTNVRVADGTVVIGDARSPGSMPTIRLCRRHGRPCLTIPPGAAPDQAARQLRAWLDEHRITTLNVAGNRVTGRGNAVPA